MIDDEQSTEQVEVDPADLADTPDSIDNGDGTTTVTVDGPPQAENDFGANLAKSLPDAELDALAEKYLTLIDQDVEDRKPRDKQYADGLKRTGIAEPAPGGAQFEGASRATHPVLAEASVDFAATAIKELFPPNGPVKSKIEGKPNREKTDRATRKTAFLNWQLTKEIRSYRPELEKLLTQLPFGGTQYAKIYWDADRGHIDSEFIPIDDFIIPYNAKDFFSCQRKFHRMHLSELEMERRINGGDYRDWKLASVSGADFTKTESEKQTDKIEGKTDESSGDDHDRTVYEGVMFDAVPGDDLCPEGHTVPYLITIDDAGRKILALYRFWEEDDPKHNEIEFVVDYVFIPWRGALGIGLPHLIGGLADALTGSLRALLDSALIATSATAIKLKGPPSGNNNTINITQVAEIDAMGADDIRKIAMPLPFPGPSPVLFELLGFLTGAAKGVVTTAEEKIAEASNNMPVGTALALIEQGSKVFSAIHARLHESQRRALEIICRLNREHLPEGKTQFGSDPQDYITRADFEGSMDVHPVSDPNIFSEAQRFAQIQAILQMIEQAYQTMPQLAIQVFPVEAVRAAYTRAFEMMKIANTEDILPQTPKPQPTDAVQENLNLVLGEPVKAFEGQDHQAHIQVHGDFSQSPFLGQSPAIAPAFLSGMLNHIQDHLLVFYEEMMKIDAATNPTMAKTMDEALAAASPVVAKTMEMAFGKIPPLMQQGAQIVQQKAQAAAPKDPRSAVMAQKVQTDAEHNKQKLALDAKKHTDEMQLKEKQHQDDIQATVAEQQRDDELAAHQIGLEQEAALRDDVLQSHTDIVEATIRSRTELEKTDRDNAAALEIAEINAQAKRDTTKVKDGESLTPDKRGDA